MSKNLCNCGKAAHYIDHNKILYCSEHKHELVYILPNTCLYEKCENIPLYGISSHPTHCILHKDVDYTTNEILYRNTVYRNTVYRNTVYNNMGNIPKNIENKCKNICNFIGCKKRKSFGYSEPLFCYEHKYYLMTNLTTKRCLMCSRYPVYGNEIPLYCGIHKEDSMVNLVHRLCECGKRANFNYFTEPYPLFCSKHKKDHMINFNSFKRVKNL